MLGVLCALFSGAFALYVTGFARLVFDPEMPLGPHLAPTPFFTPTTTSLALAIGLLVVAAPLAESLIFPPLYWLTRRLPGHTIVFTTLLGLIAYVLHGGTIVNLTQAVGFMLMALWYAHLSERYPSPSLLSPVKIPYYGVALAHFGWNATAILWSLAVNTLLGLIGA